MTVVLAWWLGLSGWACAAPPQLALDARSAHVMLAPYLSRWIDTSAAATLPQAQSGFAAGGFVAVQRLDAGGYTKAAHWLTFEVSRSAGAGETWVLDLGAPYLDDVQVWLQSPDGRQTHFQLGDRHLGPARAIHGRQHAVQLTLAPAGDHRVWIRVQSNSAINITADLWAPDVYLDHELRATAAWGVCLGLLALAATFQVLLGIWLRDRMLLAFAFYISVLVALYFGLSGFSLLAWPVAPGWYNDAVVGCASIAMLAAGSLGSMYVLEVDRFLPRGRWFYFLPAAASLLALPLAVTDFYGRTAVLMNLWGTVLAVVNIGVAVFLWLRYRGTLRGINTLASVCLGLGALTHMAMLLGLLPATAWSRNAYAGASVVYLLLTLVALSVRVGLLRHDKILAQQRVREARRFAAFVAHEFRNPLAGIDRSANLLQALPHLDQDQVAQRLHGIRRQAARLNTLIDSFLMDESGERGDLRPMLESVQVGPWLQGLCESLDLQARSRLQLTVEPSQLRARLDVRLLRIALHNLIDNALRYSPEDCAVDLKASLEPDGGLSLKVTDRGPGLSDEDLQLLGQPHHRGLASIGHQGSGLGYHFTRQIVQLHGGCLSARNVQPQGLEVSIGLPAARGA